MQQSLHNDHDACTKADQDQLQRKFSSQSSSKQTTCQSFAGLEEGVDSDWRPDRYQSPFTNSGLQESRPIKRSNSGHFAVTPPESCTDDDLQHWPLAKHGPGRQRQPSERTKSKLLSSIADEMSRNHNQMPRHARKNSADSQDSVRRAARKRRAWQLTKAFSAPGEDVLHALETGAWETNSPCESGDWAQQTYHNEQGLGNQAHSGFRPEFGALRGRGAARKRYTGRYRTSRFIGVGSSNRKTQWQARILVQGKVTHLGYYATEEEAARIYDRVALSMNPGAQTNFPASHYPKGQVGFAGLDREDLQRALGVKPMDKSSRFRGVSRKKGKWEAKVMVNRKWAFRALFDSEDEAAHAYDAAVWRLKPREATSFINFKDGVPVRNSPAKTPKKSPQTSPSDPKSVLDLPVIKLEEHAEPLGANAATLSEIHIPGARQDEFPGSPADSPPEPLQSRSVQLPIFRVESMKTVSEALPPIQALTSAPSLPELGLTSQASILTAPGGISLSPRQSMCDQNVLPSVAALPALMPHLDLPDPNSIGVPPPENLPFPELVRQGGVEMLSQGLAPTRSLSSTPSRSFVQPELFTGQAPTRAPSRNTSSGLPPLHGRSSIASEDPSMYLCGNLATVNASTPRSPYAEIRPESGIMNNPFIQAASLPDDLSSADVVALPNITPIESQRSPIKALDVPTLLHPVATGGLLSESTLSGELQYTASLPELGVPGGMTPQLSHIHSLASINTAQYAPQAAQLPPPSCGTPVLGSPYAGGNLSQAAASGLPQVESAFSYDPAQTLANSRTASSNFLHTLAANSGILMPPAETGVPATSSGCSSLPLMSASEIAAMRHELAPLPRHPLHHSVSMDASFLGRPELMEAQMMQPVMPTLQPLSVQQADLLRNLDVDVELNDPVPIAPVQIGGENMNVYSAHIMGSME